MTKKIVIGASMRFKDLIKETMAKLEELGYAPIFPNLDYTSENRDVALSIEEKGKLAEDHYKAIDEGDVVYFILPEGYMGTSCKTELGYAYALKRPIYFSEKTDDFGLDYLCKKVIPLDNLKEFDQEEF